jgi:tetratricopeptide (TPR) repeat protein
MIILMKIIFFSALFFACIPILYSQEQSVENGKNREEMLLLKPYTTWGEVLCKFGEPDDVVGSGFWIVQYNLPDGRKVVLNFGTGNSLHILSEISIQGEKNEIFRCTKGPYDPDRYSGNGVAYFNLKRYAQAVENYSKAIELRPDYSDYYLKRGTAYFRWEKYAEALQDLNKALELDPADKNAYAMRAEIYGILAQQTNDINQRNEYGERARADSERSR